MAKFAKERIAPRVRAMDEAAKMDPEIIRGLFEAGVRVACYHFSPRLLNRAMQGLVRERNAMRVCVAILDHTSRPPMTLPSSRAVDGH